MSSGNEPSASFHAPTGRLMLQGPGWSGIGTPDEWEERARLIMREVRKRRLEAYEGQWPDGFFSQIAGI